MTLQFPVLQQLDQRYWLHQRQRDMLCQLELAQIIGQVLGLHTTQVEKQAVPAVSPLCWLSQ